MSGYRKDWRITHRRKWIFVATILLLSACGHSMPDSITGTWVTDHPQYQNCILRIENSHITFGDPEGNINECAITSASTTKDDQTLAVTIEYVDKEKILFTIELLFPNANGGLLVLKNQKDVLWKRQN
jgi:hypothetical protein